MDRTPCLSPSLNYNPMGFFTLRKQYASSAQTEADLTWWREYETQVSEDLVEVFFRVFPCLWLSIHRISKKRKFLWLKSDSFESGSQLWNHNSLLERCKNLEAGYEKVLEVNDKWKSFNFRNVNCRATQAWKEISLSEWCVLVTQLCLLPDSWEVGCQPGTLLPSAAQEWQTKPSQKEGLPWSKTGCHRCCCYTVLCPLTNAAPI